MGSHIHAVAAVGTAAVEDLASELEEDCSWLQAQQQPAQQPQQPPPQQLQQHQQQQQRVAQQEEQQREQYDSTADAAHAHWPLPPPSVSRKVWAHATPVMLQVGHLVIVTLTFYFFEGWEGRWNCRCIRRHYAVTPSLLDTLTHGGTLQTN